MKKGNYTNRVPIYLIDAFTNEPFKGNPAVVCVLERPLATHVLQSIAAEMNLSETAFFYSLEEKPLKESKTFSLRWFTPKVEMPLCGHATLATAAVLFYGINISTNEVTFETKSGKLIARKDKNGIALDFPAEKSVPVNPGPGLLEAMGIAGFKEAEYVERTGLLLISLLDENVVRNLKPNFEILKATPTKKEIRGVIVTSRSRPPYDFVSRFFAPWIGIDEDPVTGSAHTILAAYWSRILGKKEMFAYQASQRGGTLTVRLRPNSDRIELIGNAVIVSRGELYLPDT